MLRDVYYDRFLMQLLAIATQLCPGFSEYFLHKLEWILCILKFSGRNMRWFSFSMKG